MSDRGYAGDTREANAGIRDLIEGVEDARTLDNLGEALSRLSQSIEYYCSAHRGSMQVYQEASTCITRMRLVLGDLERIDVLSKGASRELAERYVEMESRIRRVSFQLIRAMRKEC